MRKKRKRPEKHCVICGADGTNILHFKMYCKSCRAKIKAKRGSYKEIRKCLGCGVSFEVYKSSPKAFCSTKCRKEYTYKDWNIDD